MAYYASITSSSFFVSTENTGRVLAKFQKHPYKFELDGNGNITGVSLSSSPIGNDLPVFQAIAPYVRNSSMILFRGEEGERWKYIFQNGTCRKTSARIVWEE